jgi:hypothetical protein
VNSDFTIYVVYVLCCAPIFRSNMSDIKALLALPCTMNETSGKSFLMYTVKSVRDGRSLNFAFATDEIQEDNQKKRMEENLKIFVGKKNYFDEHSVQYGQNILEMLADDRAQSNRVEKFNKNTLYVQIEKDKNNRLEIWEEKCNRNTVQFNTKHFDAWQSEDAKIKMALTLGSDGSNKELSISQYPNTADFFQPDHFLRIMGAMLSNQEKQGWKMPRFEYNPGYLHSSEDNPNVSKNHSPSTKIIYGVLTYYNASDIEMGVMCSMQYTPFKYELQKSENTLNGKVENLEKHLGTLEVDLKNGAQE